MSWQTTDPMHQRHCFIEAHSSGLYTVTELAERFSVSRKTAYKWINRYTAEGSPGLEERNRAPKHSPQRMAEDLQEIFLQLRREHATWGARKLLHLVHRMHPERQLPAASTVTALLKQHQLIRARRSSRRFASTPLVELVADRPNAVWCIDFKGEFRLGNQQYCYPLTVSDAYSRYVLGCEALTSTASEPTYRSVKRLFEQYGLPEAIRSDNGVPFVSGAIEGLSPLNVWWMKLGIVHQRIQPGHPEQNGRHERMHRVLKAETTRPPELTMSQQQRRFDHWCIQYNTERPHQAIGYACPAELYVRSPREMPSRVLPPEYPGHCEVRLVGSNGMIRLNSNRIFLSSVLSNEQVALEQIDDGIWNVLFYNVLLGRFDERHQRLF